MFSSVPIPEIVMLTVSPATNQRGGVIAAATPDGVPVAMMSPGSSVIAWVTYSTMS